MRFFIFLSILFILSSCQKKSDGIESQPLARLMSGNDRFLSGNLKMNKRNSDLLHDLSEEQHPYAVIVSCSDSRISPNVLFDTDLGDLFIIRTAGNILDEVGLASIEYAVENLDTKLVVILGHKKCGVIHTYLSDVNPPHHIHSLVDSIRNEPEELALKKMNDKDACHYELANIMHQYKYVLNNSELIRTRLKENKVQLVQAYLDTENGKVKLLNN